MKNFVQHGNAVTITAASAVGSGGGVLVGALFGVAAGDIAVGQEGVINVTGVYDLPKAASQAWTVGARIYWDAATGRCTTVATDNTAIGVAVLAVGGGAGETTGRVRLNGAAV
jgi:predicted RecA/RadA family phage recombinase